jgi:hypothetical protein
MTTPTNIPTSLVLLLDAPPVRRPSSL